jgi:hydroxyethylthiazole kinase-like uncharacterized protein yjeF
MGVEEEMEILTAAEMRAVEAAAISGGAATGLGLMERAGRGVVDATLHWRPDLATRPHRAVVLCGPGANGGDGFVIARLLAQRGWEVAAAAFGPPARAGTDAAEMRRRWSEIGVVRDPGAVSSAGAGADLLIDAGFGTGLTRPVPDVARDALAAWTGEGIVAVDAPSGLCLDSGRARGAVRAADLTVTFHRAKRGHFLDEGPALCGRLAVVDIGLEPVAGACGPRPATLASPDVARLAKRVSQHKYDHGHLLVLGGGVARGGAARLAARAALRVGAGLVTLGCPGAALIENAARLDAVMIRRVDDADDLRALLEDARIATVVLGPGLGVGDRTRALVEVALASEIAVVLDADALTSFAEAPGALFAALRGARAVLTPHGGEFWRLFPAQAAAYARETRAGPLASRIDMAEGAAKLSGAVVLLKGADTIIAAPDGGVVVNAAVHDRAAPWLATAGSGDVLAGLIGGLMARGFAPMAAAETGAWVHVEAARTFGAGLIAEDLPEAIPGVLRALGA